jgi:CubicO group peptidase (beta-lactamase class C family)
MRRAAWVAAGTLVAVLLAAGVLAWRAPQVLALAAEGFPGAVWPVAGQFATVAGAGLPDPPAGPPAPQAALDRLAESRGRALIAERHGVLIAEAYGPGIDRDTRLNSYSMVKSLIGALTLRAIADGRFTGSDQPLRDILGPDAPEVTVGQALTMTSGLVMPDEPPKTGTTTLDDEGFSPFGPFARIHAYGIAATMEGLRVDPALAGQFHYQSANTALLGLALERAYGRPLPDLLSDLIWRPAGAADAYWRLYPAGEGVSAYCCLYARPIDWLRVGRFVLDNGSADAPFLPEDLWRRFVRPDLDPDLRRQGAYGDQIRHDVLDREGQVAQGPFAYFTGLYGQMTYLVPDTDAVIVRFGDGVQLLHSTVYDLFPAGAAP